MLKHCSIILFVSVLVFLTKPQVVFGQFDPNHLLSDDQMLDVYSTTKPEIEVLLRRGTLADVKVPNVHGQNQRVLDIIWDVSQQFGINPRFLLVLLQREQSLVEDDDPNQDQFDWAMGYAVCDDCQKTDPRIQKFKGFGNQIYYAAKRIRESYITDLNQRGFTETGVGPGLSMTVDGISVTPTNQATSVLYTYTPHVHGNENFVRIWQRWFQALHVNGTLLQDKISGGIWLIQNGLRRPITSRAAFVSRFNLQNVIQVGPSVLEDYAQGDPIRFPNYALLRSPGGTVYLIVDDTRRGFISQEAFRRTGFSTDEIVDVTWNDLAPYREGAAITIETTFPHGGLLQDMKTGGVFFVRDGQKHPIMSREILKAHFPNPAITPASTEELSAYEVGTPLQFPDGTLVAVQGSPEVSVITQGTRRPIADEETFISLGWRWDQIVWTNERSVLIHPLGETLRITQDVSDIQLTTI